MYYLFVFLRRPSGFFSPSCSFSISLCYSPHLHPLHSSIYFSSLSAIAILTFMSWFCLLFLLLLSAPSFSSLCLWDKREWEPCLQLITSSLARTQCSPRGPFMSWIVWLAPLLLYPTNAESLYLCFPPSVSQLPWSRWPAPWPKWSCRITCATWCSLCSTVTVSTCLAHKKKASSDRRKSSINKSSAALTYSSTIISSSLPCPSSPSLLLSPSVFLRERRAQ